MCHCFEDITELSEAERADVLESHSTEELHAEYSASEREALGIAH